MRKHILNAKSSLVLFAMIVVLTCSSSAFAGATIVIVNIDGPGEGFNDPTPVAPVGGNPGTTRGEQRLIAFTHAANIWGSTLDSNVPIRIQAAFNPLPAGVLGSAGATFIFRDFGGVGLFPGAEFPATWYGSALADKRAGTELNPTPNTPDINAQFSSNFNFYLGLDNNHGAQPDRGVHRQSNAQSFDHAGHGGSGAHGHAVAGGTAHTALCFKEVTQFHRATTHVFTKLPHVCSRPNILPAEFSIQHGPT